MEDSKNLEMTQNEGQESQQDEKVFTQAEVEEIVKKRLARERRKTGQETDKDSSLTGRENSIAERESSLAERELKITAREKLQAQGLPLTLADVLRYNDEKTLDAAIEAINELNVKSEVSKPWAMRVSKGAAHPAGDPIRQAMGLHGKDK